MYSVVDAFKRFYGEFGQASIASLADVYCSDVVFTDPIHIIQGLDKLSDYFNNICGDLSECRFEFINEVVGPGHACFKWEMYYRHPRIKNNQPIQLTGASFIEYSDKVDSHEDFYDMGAMLYEHIPVMGSAIRMIKSKMAQER